MNTINNKTNNTLGGFIRFMAILKILNKKRKK